MLEPVNVYAGPVSINDRNYTLGPLTPMISAKSAAAISSFVKFGETPGRTQKEIQAALKESRGLRVSNAPNDPVSASALKQL